MKLFESRNNVRPTIRPKMNQVRNLLRRLLGYKRYQGP